MIVHWVVAVVVEIVTLLLQVSPQLRPLPSPRLLCARVRGTPSTADSASGKRASASSQVSVLAAQ